MIGNFQCWFWKKELFHTSQSGNKIPLLKAAGLYRDFFKDWYKAKCSLLFFLISSLTRGSKTSLKKRSAFFTPKFEANILVAWYIAFGDHFSGSVKYKTSSQNCRDGMCLKALGILPEVYLLRSFPTLHIFNIWNQKPKSYKNFINKNQCYKRGTPYITLWWNHPIWALGVFLQAYIRWVIKL